MELLALHPRYSRRPKRLYKMNRKLIARPLFDETLELEYEEATPPLALPFDLSELDRIPQPTDDDPPYRPWWVVDKS